MAVMMNTSYQKTTHTNADMSDLIWRIADAIKDRQLQEFVRDRPITVTVKAVLDLRADGYTRITNVTLPAFKKKVKSVAEGMECQCLASLVELEADEAQDMDFEFSENENA